MSKNTIESLPPESWRSEHRSGELSHRQTVIAYIPLRAGHSMSAVSEKNEIVIDIKIIRSIEDPQLKVKAEHLSRGSILRKPQHEWMTVEIKRLQVLAVDGMPTMLIRDDINNRLVLSSLMKNIVDRKVPEKAMKSVWERAGNTHSFRFGIVNYFEVDVDWFEQKVKEVLPQIHSLEEAHVFWSDIIVQTLQDSGLSEHAVDVISKDQALMWDLHWQIGQTLYGSICMALTKEQALWKNVVGEKFTPTSKVEVLEVLEKYREKQLKELDRRNWRLCTDVVEPVPTEQDNVFEVAYYDFSPDEPRLILTDDTGLQVALYTDRAHTLGTILGGKISIEEAEFSDVFVFIRFPDGKLSKRFDIWTPGLKEDSFDFFGNQRWFSLKIGCHGECTQVVAFRTKHGMRTITINLNGQKFIIKGEDLSLERTLDDLTGAQELQEEHGIQAGVELVAGQRAMEILSAENTTVHSPQFRADFLNKLQLVNVFHEDDYDPFGEKTVATRFLDHILGEDRYEIDRLTHKQLISSGSYMAERMTTDETQALHQLKLKHQRLVECLFKIMFKIPNGTGNYWPFRDGWSLLVSPLPNADYLQKTRLPNVLIYLASITLKQQEEVIQQLFNNFGEDIFVRNRIFEPLNDIKQEVSDELARQKREKEKRKKQ